MAKSSKKTSTDDFQALFSTLEARFSKNMKRHPKMDWGKVKERLLAQPQKLAVLQEMEETGGEPDVVQLDPKGSELTFVDCSAESPSGRRSFCYDEEALDARKENKPKGSAVGVAKAMGIELLTEEQYRTLQAYGPLDAKTSSWILTPPDVRKLDGSLFCDFRYGKVFVYHNGSQSYYAARGFRGLLRV